MASVQADLGTARAVMQSAINTYPIIKGLALVAASADPKLAPGINAAIAAIEPNVAKAQTVLNVATAAAPEIEALAATINSQVQALTQAAAPAVVVVPAPSK